MLSEGEFVEEEEKRRKESAHDLIYRSEKELCYEPRVTHFNNERIADDPFVILMAKVGRWRILCFR